MKFVSLSINDWLAAISDADLTLEQQAVFHRLVLLTCRREANLVDEDAANAKMLGLQLRPWRRVKLALLEKRLIDIVDGELVSQFASEAIAAYAEHRNRAAEGGRKSAAKRMIAASFPETSPQVSPKFEPNFGANSGARACNPNDLAATTPNPSPNPYPNPEERERKEAPSLHEESNFESQRREGTENIIAFPKPDSRNDWVLPEQWKAYALERGLRDEEILSEAITFRAKAAELTYGGWHVWVERALNGRVGNGHR